MTKQWYVQIAEAAFIATVVDLHAEDYTITDAGQIISGHWIIPRHCVTSEKLQLQQ